MSISDLMFYWEYAPHVVYNYLIPRLAIGLFLLFVAMIIRAEFAESKKRRKEADEKKKRPH